MKGRRVLVVEDDRFMQEALRTYLADSGACVEYVSAAEDGLSRLPLFLPDVILLDQCLPGMDGLGMLKELRRLERWRSLPVVFLTAAPEVRELEAALPALGPCVLLRKPADPPAIRAAVYEMRGAP